MRTWVIVMGLCACSMGLKKIDPHWDGTSEPDCDDGIAPVVGDVLISSVALGVSIGAANQHNDGLSAGFAIGALVFAVSSAIGEDWRGDCKRAKAAWELGGAMNRGGPVPQSQEAPEAQELRRLRAEHDATELKRLRAEHNALTDAGVSVDAASDGASD